MQSLSWIAQEHPLWSRWSLWDGSRGSRLRETAAWEGPDPLLLALKTEERSCQLGNAGSLQKPEEAREWMVSESLRKESSSANTFPLDSWEPLQTSDLQNCRIIKSSYVTMFVMICYSSNHFSSVQSLSCVWLCDPMNCSTPGLPVHHQLLESTQTHVHCVSDAIQPSHPLSSPSPPALSLSQHQGLFKWVNSLHEVAKVLEFQL